MGNNEIMSKYILLVIAILSSGISLLYFNTNAILFGIFLVSASISITGFVISMLLEKNNELLDEIKNTFNKDLKDRLRNEKNDKKGTWVND